MKISINPKPFFWLLLFIIIILEVANIIGIIYSFNSDRMKLFINLFNLNTEGNIPSFYSSVLILIASFLLGLIAFFRKKLGLHYLYWLGFSFIFLLLSIDEATQIHERFGNILRSNFNLNGYLYYSWVIPYGLFSLAVLIIYSIKFLPKVSKNIKRLFLISGFIYVLGALGFELLEAKNDSSLNYSEVLNTIYYSIEELLEMLGIAIFIYSLLLYIKNEIIISIKKQPH